mmetsp:Transcript_2099/g.4675  ORF Transcript_2099/g.4675 Transcript_2099/m.4675 type:complete len:222 (+) Transcript_2099:742-1407(+)
MLRIPARHPSTSSRDGCCCFFCRSRSFFPSSFCCATSTSSSSATFAAVVLLAFSLFVAFATTDTLGLSAARNTILSSFKICMLGVGFKITSTSDTSFCFSLSRTTPIATPPLIRSATAPKSSPSTPSNFSKYSSLPSNDVSSLCTSASPFPSTAHCTSCFVTSELQLSRVTSFPKNGTRSAFFASNVSRIVRCALVLPRFFSASAVLNTTLSASAGGTCVS